MNKGEAQDPHKMGSPSEWVMQYTPLIPKMGEIALKSAPSVLDLACGKGRHTRYLLDLGFLVTAVDRNVAGLADLTDHPGLEIIEADLETPTAAWPMDRRLFAGIIVTNYLRRPLIPHIIEAIAPGGILIYETFGQGNERFGRPRNPDHLLCPGELEQAVAGKMTVIAYAHGTTNAPRPAVIQHICARRNADQSN